MRPPWLRGPCELPLANTNDTAASAASGGNRSLASRGGRRSCALNCSRFFVLWCTTYPRASIASVLGAPHDGEGYAQLAQQLQSGIAAGLQSNDPRRASDSNDPARLDLIGHATHRALSDCSRTLLRATQIHTDTPAGNLGGAEPALPPGRTSRIQPVGLE